MKNKIFYNHLFEYINKLLDEFHVFIIITSLQHRNKFITKEKNGNDYGW